MFIVSLSIPRVFSILKSRITSDWLLTATLSDSQAGNIPQTGVPDRRTEELMTRPRCGNTDDFVPDAAIYRDPYNQGNELRVRKKRYTVATSKWPRTNLTFRLVVYRAVCGMGSHVICQHRVFR